MEGRVIKSTGSWYEVLGTDGKLYTSRLQGKLRLEGIKETNPVAIGDRVQLVIDQEDASITEILPRQNHMLRQSVKKTGHSHVLAANIDQVLLVATLKHPRTSRGFIDRFLVSAESFRIPQVLLINKKDLWSPKEAEEADELQQLYLSLGVKTELISATAGDCAPLLKKLIANKTTLVAGHSGVGKSTLLNLLSPQIKQSVHEVSGATDKGTHTTTFAEMFALDPTTFIIDTPGIKEWGLVEMEPQEISDYFPEMRELRLNCKFGSRCLHVSEPKCAVLEAVEAGSIAASRYDSYVSMVT
ncbi:MAG: ribosome small subunit-dependent GTPase A, partial [Cyclobacteriaceae bacterium]|nr:ribosome small subunit-dependent GTPase A [Cyclobacteriaceae bacterium]